MYKIIKKEILVPNMIYMKLESPDIARKAKPGQFIILRVDEVGERFPMSLAGWDKDGGTLEITFQIMGRSTMKLASLGEGEYVMDIVGPLGKPTEIDYYGNVLCVCGSFGVGPMAALISTLKEKGNKIVSVMEAGSEASLFWEDKLAKISDEAHVVIGDSKAGQAGEFVEEYLKAGHKIDRAFALGRLFMMMECSNATKPFGVNTIVCLTPIMVDGTGMCGCCRVSVGGETKFACVDGPEFDGHLVDWELLIKRKQAYIKEEAIAFDLFKVDTLCKVAELSKLPKRVSVV
ncbi:MAG: sulfide/dihydroorotate dehydrogenase-like FAD/NAD-binding protein [Chloroflexota bacterium]|nr:sulfide/dihydroorotate dehydrogenase-like FAD/NAD-binding protein [Chloroflexota bacterium]